MDLLHDVKLQHGTDGFTSLRRKACWGLFRPKNPNASAGCESLIMGTKGQHAISRPPKPRIHTILHGVTPPITHNLSVFPISCYSNCINFWPSTVLSFSSRQHFSVSLHSLFLPARLISLFSFTDLPPYWHFHLFTSPFHPIIFMSLFLNSIQCETRHDLSLLPPAFQIRPAPFLAIGEYQVLAISCRYSLPDLWHVAFLLIMKLFDPVSTATRRPPGVFVFSVVTSSARSEYQIRARNCAQVLSISETSNTLDS
jgi:hypothetical protein